MVYLHPHGRVEVHIPVAYSVEAEYRTVILDLIQAIALGVISFPSHRHGIEPMDFRGEQRCELAVVEQTVNLREIVPLAVKT